MNEHIFRAYDIRGIYQKEVSEEFAEEIGKSFGTFLGNQGLIVLGRDARHGGHELVDASARGLNAAGINTIDIGMLPTPTLNYYCAKAGANAGVLISASHNPPEYNGIRFRKGDGAGFPECIPEVKRIYFEKSWQEKDAHVSHRTVDSQSVIDEYLDYIVSQTQLQKPLKVVVDPGNGSGSGIGKPLFEALGCEVTTINDSPDGDFPGRSANPKESTLIGLGEEVRKRGADLGVAYDGDADRVVFTDENGRVVSAEASGAIMVNEVLEEGLGEIALNVDCSMSVEEAAIAMGGTVRRIRVGDVFLADAIKDGAVFAMESSSHFVVPKYFGFDDGIAVSAYMAQILSERGEPLSKIVSKVPRYPVVRKEMPVPDDKKFKVIEALAEQFADRNPLTIDGVKVNYNKGWTLVRASNTQPMLRLTAEGKTEKDAEDLMSELEGSVKENL
jgi:phosphoglucosamine mutase